MANYKRKRHHPLRACRLCKFHKYMGNSEAAKKPRYRRIRERQDVEFKTTILVPTGSNLEEEQNDNG